MRTNKACPLYTGSFGEGMGAMDMIPNLSVVTPDASVDGYRRINLDDSIDDSDKGANFEDSDELINVDGTKIKLSSKVMKVKFLNILLLFNEFFILYNILLYITYYILIMYIWMVWFER